MIFNYDHYQIDIKTLIKLSGQKKRRILDFGCGKGVWGQNRTSIKGIDKIILYDKEKKLTGFLKKKYKLKKIKINFNYKKILNEEKYNIVIFSSVIQYIEKNKLKRIIYDIAKNKSREIFILSDVPLLPRFLEFIILPILNFRRFIFVCSIIFSRKYKNVNYNYYKKNDFNFYSKDFDVSFHSNLHDLKLLRRTIVLKLKKN
tara:strand:+ start:1041 stop:1646 length:606 start_codon:yes stop_codon:yes gene_type:complete